jgi:hypothetical protein
MCFREPRSTAPRNPPGQHCNKFNEEAVAKLDRRGKSSGAWLQSQKRKLHMKHDVTATESSQKLKVGDHSILDVSLLRTAGTLFLEKLVKSNSAVIKGSLELTQDTLTFSKVRLQANIEAWMALPACQNLSELYAWQIALAKKATSQYTDAASNVVNRFASVMSSAAVPIREQSPNT